ncbi:hypothetical protein KRX51_03805 [Corynebacterium sp. TAE3-ERU12]|uniref:ABC transporter substrate-binding protein n=1 Tax=Corynebacterium sp. TAE3-ERU12 TaxID=2849491 RepID=UPI001C45A591|nr:ABC transporter substrate-binding protein [Corynebacterium sp. TAE3-ERU12]MBV7295042.1 hypothetical protein [Corynebacterium sp. TAE3-ERU12]
MTSGSRVPQRARRGSVAATLLSAGLLSACMVQPTEAPIVDNGDANQVPVQVTDPEASEITVGVGEFDEGFNPHLAYENSPVVDLVANMVLPSAFVHSPVNPDRLVMNADLLESADIVDADGDTADDPDTAARAAGRKIFRYRIKPGAQWSDGTPISGSDFTYLRDGITSTPGVRNAAAYERIERISTSGGGRIVDVTVDGPLPEWRTLFTHLLPSHLLRSSGDSFATIMRSEVLASGNVYAVKDIDIGRNEIRLVRNDRFWGSRPPLTESLVLRAERGPVAGAELLRSGRLQAVQVRPEETTSLNYSMVPGATEVTFNRPRTLTVQANVSSPRLAEAPVRRAVLGAINQSDVAAVATGRRNDLQIPQRWPVADDAAVAPLPAQPLVIGAMGDATSVAAARAIAAELSAAGVPTTVSGADADDLARTLLPYGQVDLVVGWVDEADTVLAMADRFGCPSESRVSRKPDNGQATPPVPPSTWDDAPDEDEATDASADTSATSSATTSTTTTSTEPADADTSTRRIPARGTNLSGICDQDVEQLLTQYADTVDVPEELTAAVAAEAVELPIVRDTVLTVVGDSIIAEGFSTVNYWPADAEIGIFMTMPQWRRID